MKTHLHSILQWVIKIMLQFFLNVHIINSCSLYDRKLFKTFVIYMTFINKIFNLKWNVLSFDFPEQTSVELEKFCNKWLSFAIKFLIKCKLKLEKSRNPKYMCAILLNILFSKYNFIKYFWKCLKWLKTLNLNTWKQKFNYIL